MRMKSLCCYVLAWAFVFAGCSFVGLSHKANAQQPEKFGECSYYSVDRIEKLFLECRLIENRNILFSHSKHAIASGFVSQPELVSQPKLPKLLKSVGFKKKLKAESNVKPAVSVKKKTVGNASPIKRAPLEPAFSPIASIEFFKTSLPNWTCPVTKSEKATWEFDYKPQVKSAHRVKWYKNQVRPITTSKAITIVKNQSNRLIGKSSVANFAATIDLDQIILQVVRVCSELVESVSASQMDHLALWANEIKIEKVGEAYTNLLSRFNASEPVVVELPDHLQGSDYWQYYDDCDQWGVLINTAIDDETFDAKPENEKVGPSKGFSFVPFLLNRSPSIAVSIAQAFNSDFIANIRFKATESKLGLFLQPVLH